MDREFGTGALKITPGHDPNDYEIGRRVGLPTINIMNDDGTLNAAAGAYAGLDRFAARERIWADLEVRACRGRAAPKVRVGAERSSKRRSCLSTYARPPPSWMGSSCPCTAYWSGPTTDACAGNCQWADRECCAGAQARLAVPGLERRCLR